MHRNTILLLAALAVSAPALSACENFDLDKLDVLGLSEKKKLPGERKQLFPEGVPGVQQGVPKEYMKGFQEQQQQQEAARQAALEAEQAAAAEKAKQAALEAEKKRAQRKKPTQITVQRQRPQQQQPQAQQGGQQGSDQQPAQAPWPQQPATSR